MIELQAAVTDLTDAVASMRETIRQLKAGVVFIVFTLLVSFLSLGAVAGSAVYSANARHRAACNALTIADQRMKTRTIKAIDVWADHMTTYLVDDKATNSQIDAARLRADKAAAEVLNAPSDKPDC